MPTRLSRSVPVLLLFAALAWIPLVQGCGDDDPPPGQGGRTLSVPLDNEFGPLSLVQALEMALPRDTIFVRGGHRETLARTVVIQASQTPLVLTGTRVRPVVTAPMSGPSLRFQDPKEGTRVELLEFHGGNAALQADGGALMVTECLFREGQVHLRGRNEASLDVSECIMDRPQAFGIEVSGGSVRATQNTIYRAGDCGMYIAGGARLTADKNIISESVQWGIACQVGGNITGDSLCNDVYDSGTAPYSAACTVPETDFSLDPLFCDPSAGDFRVNVQSPCAPQNVAGSECAGSGDPNLGVGALGVGCTPSDEE